MQSDIVSNYSYDNNADENLGKNIISFDFFFVFFLLFFTQFLFYFIFISDVVYRLYVSLTFEILICCEWLNNLVDTPRAAGSIKTFQSLNSLATSMATSLAISSHSINSDDSDKTTEVTRL